MSGTSCSLRFPAARFLLRVLLVAVAAVAAGCATETPTSPEQPSTDTTDAAVSGERFGPPDRVGICHAVDEPGSWRKLELPERAADQHLANHDDAEPGGTTAITGTPLDEECAAVECRCYDAAFLTDHFQPGPPTRPLSCTTGFFSSFIQDTVEANGPWNAETLLTVEDTWSCRLSLLGGSDPLEVNLTISETEAAACKAEIATAVSNLGC